MDLSSPVRPARAAAARLALLLPALALGPAAGCVTSSAFALKHDAPPTGQPCQVVATWTNEVTERPDPTRGGDPVKGLAGRVYLFGPQGDFPIVGDGKLSVALYELRPGTPRPDHPLEVWNFDAANLRRLAAKDTIGWGYSLFLPWGTLRPDISAVTIKACYEPPTGFPLYADSGPMTINREGVNFVPPQVSAVKTVTPGAPAAATAAPGQPSLTATAPPRTH